MANPKLLVVVPSEVYGGGEEYIYSLLTSKQITSSFNIFLASACPRLNCLLTNHVSITLSILEPSRSLSVATIRNIYRINKLILERSIDVTLLNGLPEIGVFSKYIKGAKICVAHSNEDWVNSNKHASFKRYIKMCIAGNYTASLKALIVVSKKALENISFISELFSKTTLIRNSVRPVLINSESSLVPKWKGCIVFGRISRLCPGKGNENLIIAFEKLTKTYPRVKLLLAGDGPDYEKLKLLAFNLGIADAVEFSGHVDKSQFFSSVNCMISPSDMEAAPLVVLEAMSAHVPVIATNVGDVPSLIRDGISGRLILPFSIQEIENSMIDYLTDQDAYQEYAEVGYEIYMSEFNFDVMLNKTSRVLKEAL